VIAVTIATVLLPNLSRLHAGAQGAAFAHTLEWGLRTCLLFAVPAAAALYVLSVPLMATIFLHGAMTAQDVRMAALSLDAFAAGLLGFALVKVVAPAYFSREDTRTPFRIAVVAVAVNIALSLASFRWMGHVGVAFATTSAAIVQSYLLLRGVLATGVYRPSRELAVAIVRVLLATAVMVALLKGLAPSDPHWLAAPIRLRAIWLTGLSLAGLASYALMLWLAGVRPRDLRHRV
jgi:putative peptidoglycan lipid II flippase